MAVKFNKENEKYRIRIHEYFNLNTNSYQSAEEAMTALNMEIISGKVPDMLSVPYA